MDQDIDSHQRPKTWRRDLVMTREADEHFFNTSVCKDDQGFVLPTNQISRQWSFQFARSKDLVHWEKQTG
jgi:beta-xylosidase